MANDVYLRPDLDGPNGVRLRTDAADSGGSPPLSWAPSFPPAVDDRPYFPALAPAFFAIFALAQWAVPANAWQSVYPDRIPPAPGLQTASQQAVADAIGALPNLPVPLLSWRATYPEPVEAAGLRADQQQSLAFVARVAVAPAEPLLSWAPTYPGPQPAPPLITAAQQSATLMLALAQYSVPALSWAPVFVDQAQGHPGLRSHLQQPFTQDQIPPAPPLLSWAPTFPDALAEAPRILEGQSAFIFVDAIVTIPMPGPSGGGGMGSVSPRPRQKPKVDDEDEEFLLLF